MKYLFCFLMMIISSLSITAQDCEPGEAHIFLDGNSVTAQLRTGGDLWWDGLGNPHYFTADQLAKGDSTIPLFVGGLWVVGLDESGNVHSATSRYPVGNVTDYWPGPVPSDGLANATICSSWDRFFKVNKSEIDAHLSDLAADNVVDTPLESIYSWPSRGNPYFEDYTGYAMPPDQDLAPFIDVDGDGIYDPNAGDYPAIKGSQSIWWVYNDVGNNHLASNTDPVGVEVQVMAYAQSSRDDALDYTTFYDYKVINKWGLTYPEFYAGFFVDPDLGCYLDDYVGVDSTRNMAYCYNADDLDGVTADGQCPGATPTYSESLPMVGLSFISSSVSEPALSSCLPRVPNQYVQPFHTSFQPYNSIRGLWNDGRPLTYGGDGYNVGTNTDTARYIYPADPANADGWSACTADLEINDYQLVMGSGPTTWTTDQTIELTVAAIYVPEVEYPCPSIKPLQDAYDRVVAALPELPYVPPIITGELLTIDANPTPGIYQVELGPNITELVVYDLSGKLCQGQSVTSLREVIDISEHPVGLYIIAAVATDGTLATSKKVVKTY